MHGLVLTGGAALMLAGCTGSGQEAAGPAAAPSVPASPAPTTATGAAAEPVGSGAAAPTGKAVGKATARPVIGRVWTDPRLPCDATVCTLSPPIGTVTFHARVSAATSVEFFLVPTGTGTAGYARSIGLDRDGRDGWTATYRYADEPLLSHLTIAAHGPGGTAERLAFNVYHPDPSGPAVRRVWTDPQLPCRDGWCTLPAGTGTLTIHAEVRNALGGVSFFLDPAGGGKPILLGTAVDRGSGYSIAWSYPDAPRRAHLRVSAGNNLGHRSSTAFGLLHP
jgi:hypothetical protein